MLAPAVAAVAAVISSPPEPAAPAAVDKEEEEEEEQEEIPATSQKEKVVLFQSLSFYLIFSYNGGLNKNTFCISVIHWGKNIKTILFCVSVFVESG